jgi:hypothetical protein
MSGLIEAGMRFLEAISFVATGPESAPTPAGRLNGPPKDFVSDIIRTDSETGVPMLTIPLPETVTTERVANAIGSFLRTFQARG